MPEGIEDEEMCEVNNEVENVKESNENVLEYVPKDTRGERVTETEVVPENEVKKEVGIEVNDKTGSVPSDADEFNENMPENVS